MTSVLIIDDEQDARENLQLLIKSYCNNEVEIISETDNIHTGLQLIEELQPDIVLLDIQIGNNNGFELLEKVKFKNFSLIFTTGYSEFAAKAFRYDAIDYLLKPIHPDHLIAAIEKAKKQKPIDHLSAQFDQFIASKDSSKITITSKNGITFISVEDIVRIQGDGNYSYFFMQNGEKIVATKNLKSIGALIKNKYFLRIHQSYIVNFKYLQKILFEDGTFIVTSDGAKTPVSRSKKEVVREFVKTIF